MSFENLGLSAALLRAVQETGYTTPTPIQAQAIPAVLEGKDVMAAAQTGTGKTAGFVLPLLQRLTQSPPKNRGTRALVLVPTRELAAQVRESINTYGRHVPVKSAVIFGGVGFQPQISALRRGVEIVVATPGRLLDLMQQGHADLSGVETLILDEADRMLDMGFIHDIRKVIAALPRERQTLMFSATFNDDIRKLAGGMLHNPVQIEVAARNTTAEKINQKVHPVSRAGKRALLSHLISDGDWKQVLVFTRTKHGANRLAEQLDKDGLAAMAIHGNKSQTARTKALAQFQQGRLRVLVATDIAARGLDIEQLPHVVNFELPNVPEDYVHRIGRTGRAGHGGEAVSLVCVDEHKLLNGIEKLLRVSLDKQIVAGFEPDPAEKAQPLFKKPNGRRGAPAPRGGQGRPGAPRGGDRRPGNGRGQTRQRRRA